MRSTPLPAAQLVALQIVGRDNLARQLERVLAPLIDSTPASRDGGLRELAHERISAAERWGMDEGEIIEEMVLALP